MGGYGFDPQEDDDLEQFIAARAAQARPEFTPPPVAPMEPRGSLSSLIAPRDPEMDSRWRGAEQQALDRSGFGAPQSYGVAEGVRDFAPMAVGSLAALLTGDKGRSIPYLAGAGMQANAVQQRNRDARAQQAGDFALASRRQREDMGSPALDAAYKQAQIQNWNEQRDIARQNLGQRDLRQQFQELKLRLERDPSDPQALAMAGQIYEQTGIDVRGQLGAQNQGRLMPIAGRQQGAQLAGPVAAAQTQGRIDTELANAPQTTAAAADRAAAETGARVRATTGAEREIGASTPIANASIANPQVWGTLNDAQRTKAMAAAEAYKVFGAALETMEGLAAKHGVQNLPSGDKSAYDAAHGAALGQLADLYRTGVINEKEYERMAARLPQSGGVRSTAAAAVGWATGQDNILGEQLKGAGGETLNELAAKMSQYGLAPPAAKPQPTAAAPASAGPASKYADPGYVPDALDVNGPRGVRNTPDFPGGAPVSRLGGKPPGGGGGAQPVMMRDPEGEVGPVQPSLVKQAEAAGYTRVQ